MWKILHNRLTVLLQLKGVYYSELYMEVTGKQVDSDIVACMVCVKLNIMWKISYSRWTLLLHFECSVLKWTLCLVTEQQVDSCIVAWMVCVIVYFMWLIQYSSWTVVLQLEWIVLQWTFCRRYYTVDEQLYGSLNGFWYSEHYLEVTAQQVVSVIASWMNCVTVNIMWKVLHSMLSVLLQLEWIVLQ